MRRALFRLHFERLALPLAITALVVFAGLGYLLELVARGSGSSADRRELVDMFVAVVIVFGATYAGSAPFTRAFKERQIVFVHTLPLRRWEAWLMTAGGALAAYLSFILLSCLLRPSLLGHVNTLLEGSITRWSAVLLLLLLVFAAGACGSLLGMHPAAMFISILLSGFACFAAAAIGAGRHIVALDQYQIGEITSVVSLRVLPAAIPALLLASALLFAEGEIFVLRRLPRRLAVIALVIAIAFAGGDVLARFGSLGVRRHIESATVSPDHMRVALLERQPAMRDNRVTIYDTHNGKLIEELRGPYVDVRWTRDGTRLVVRTNASLTRSLLGLDSAYTIERRASDGRLLGTETFPEGWLWVYTNHTPGVLLSEGRLDDRCALATLSADGRIVRRIELPDARELYRSQVGSTLYVRPDRGSRMFRIRNDVDEVPIVGTRPELDQVVVGDAVYERRRAAAELARIAPLSTLPSSAGVNRVHLCDLGRYTFRGVCVADGLDALAWSEPSRGTVYRFDPRAKQWNLIAADVRLDRGDLDKVDTGVLARPMTMRRLVNDDFAWVQRSGEASLLRYRDRVLSEIPPAIDVELQRRFDIAEPNEPRELLTIVAMTTRREQVGRDILLDLDRDRVLTNPWQPFNPTRLDRALAIDANGERIEYERRAIVTRTFDGRVVKSVKLEP